MSQLDLANDSELSVRHLSFVETGRSKPSPETIMRLAGALALPLRERNALFLAAGYASPYEESELASADLEHLRRAIDLILRHQEPYPAFVINRYFDVIMANEAAIRINSFLMDGRKSAHTNLLHQIFDPADFRSVIVNWHDVAGKFLRHLHEELIAVPSDSRTRELLDQVMRYPGVPEEWHRREMGSLPDRVLTMVFESRDGHLRFFETITTFASPRDIALEELRIDCAFPADDLTVSICTRLADDR